jgi:cytochrome P450
VFLIAGFDTTSTALSYCFYCLSKYPKEMKRLQEEIDSMMEKNNVIESFVKFKIILKILLFISGLSFPLLKCYKIVIFK